MVHCVWHLPAGFARHLRCPVATLGRKGPEAYCALVRLWTRDVEPTADSLAAYFNWGRNKANHVLRFLTELGYIYRWRRSAGRDRLVNFALVTDEPFAWQHDDALASQMAELEDRALAPGRQSAGGDLDPYARHEPVDTSRPAAQSPAASTTPPTSEDAAHAQVASPAGVSDTKTGQAPIKDSLHKSFTPNPRCGRRVASRQNRTAERNRGTTRTQERHEARHDGRESLMADLRGLVEDPALAPHIPAAISILHGLEFNQVERVRHAHAVAAALRRGYPEGDVIRYFTDGLASARSIRAVLRYRLSRLPSVLEQRAAQPLHAGV